VWLSTSYKAEDAVKEYNKKVSLSEQKQIDIENEHSDLGRERYQKDFFNKLDDGENLIILYGAAKEENLQKDEEERKMFWWEEMYQNYKVWWKNLEVI
jgi:hypothetical protein